MKRYLYGLFFVFVTVAFFSCAPKKEIQISQKSPLEVGDYLWDKGDYQSACKNYEETLYNYLVSGQREVLLLQRMVKCALDNKELDKARSYLYKWKSLDPDYNKKWKFHKYYLTYLQFKNKKDKYYKYLSDLLIKDFPVAVKKKGFILLEISHLKEKDINGGRSVFENYYHMFGAEDQYDILNHLYKVIKENKIATEYEISALDPEKLPDGLILWSKVLSLFGSGEITWSRSYGLFQNILNKNPRLKGLFLEKFRSLVAKYGLPRIELALVLPFDPSYREVSFGILRGVEAGIYEMESMGIETHVTVFNSATKDFVRELNDIVRRDLIIGGLLKVETWNEILKTDIPQKAHLFAFRSSIPDEGVDGFRFFPSHRDQVDSLIKFFMGNFQIDSFGIFYPKGEYGRVLGEEFFNEAKSLGAKIQAISWYDPKDTKGWQVRVGKFLGVPDDVFEDKDKEKIKEFKPEIDFSAVFIPDSLENARIIIPNFFYFNASDIYFMGPALWGTSKPEFSGLETSMFRRAYYPAPWKDDSSNYVLTNLKKLVFDLSKMDVNFWTCLGYDFFRYAVYLQDRLKDGSNIYSILNNPKFMWTMAPLEWNEKGIASQHMFVFRVY